MKASIVIPVYNQAQYVRGAVDSALNQTYADREVIVVIDGATDDSLAVARSYGDSIKVVDQPNRGLAEARNAGVRDSTGDVLLPLDADDWIDKEYLRKTVPLMTDGVGVVTTELQYFGEYSGPGWQPRKPTLQMIMVVNCVAVTSLIRRAAFLEIGGYRSRSVLSGYEDWNLWIDLVKRGWDVVVVNEPLFHYRVRSHSLLAEAGMRRDEIIQQIKRLHPDLYS